MKMPNENHENLGPAERIINTLITHIDHLVHNRPGMVVPDARTVTGVRWEMVTHVPVDGKKVVYKVTKTAPAVEIETEIDGEEKKVSIRGTKVGTLWQDGTIRDENRHKVADYRPAGIFPEVAVWAYRQVAEVWQLDNEFAAHWASYAFSQDHIDLKTVLAAFFLVQSRKGDPVREGGEILFHDEDYRDIGEAMILNYEKRGDGKKDNRALGARHLLRIHDFLMLPEIAEINRELGFGKSARNPCVGRWPKVVQKWLRFREDNPKVLEGLIRAGAKQTVIQLASRSGYKPSSPKFFQVVGWNQKQAKDGRRGVALDQKISGAESWEGKTEAEVCALIMKERPAYKRIISLVPVEVGLTRAVVAAAIEAGAMSNKELIIATPTLEDLGLLKVQEIREKWEAAGKEATDQRAANIARNVKSKETRNQLQDAADTAVKKAVEEELKALRVYFLIDRSSSMEGAIDKAKEYIEKFLQGFTLDQIFVCVFNTAGREVPIKHASAAGVRNAFRGVTAGGGTDYGAAVQFCGRNHRPKDDEDVLFIFIGDEDSRPRGYFAGEAKTFEAQVRASGLNPMAFGLLRITSMTFFHGQPMVEGKVVRNTAAKLGVPCFQIDEATFDDPYAIPRTIRALVAATPVGYEGVKETARVTLVDQILQTELLQKPAWAA